MKNIQKMNILYKLGFILMFVCLALFIAAIVVLYLFSEKTLGVLIAAAGSALCLAAIVLTLLSKPKKPKQQHTPEFFAEEIPVSEEE